MNDDFKNYIQLLIDNKDKIKHLPERDIHNLLDYITNLQQELENKNNEVDVLKDQIKWWQEQCDDLEMQIGENSG